MEIKKIKIIGQPMYNIGDLAACKSLSKLLQNGFNPTIEYSIFENRQIDSEFLKIEGVRFINNIPILNKYEKIIPILSPKLLKLFLHIFPNRKKKYYELLNSDFVLLSPGGLELGLYKEWDYLWLFSVLVAYNKNFGVYSRSIGDFQHKTLNDYLFKKKTIKFLKQSKFNGLRDLKSQQLASQLKIPFYSSIDVVFSDIPSYDKIKESIENKLKNDYIVFTPSAFDWHPKLCIYPEAEFSIIYLEIINTLIQETNKNIVMLPHIYKDNKDLIYFNYLKENCKDNNRVIVLENKPDSDIYQFIISKAKLTIAARSHQVIFSINNHTPFLCLSYEHKMEDMLKMLELEKYSIRLQDLLQKKVVLSNFLNIFLLNEIDEKELIKAQQKAKKIALSSFKSLSQILDRI